MNGIDGISYIHVCNSYNGEFTDVSNQPTQYMLCKKTSKSVKPTEEMHKSLQEHKWMHFYLYKYNQGSTEGHFLPSAEAKAEGAKKLRPSAEDRSQSRRFQIIELLHLFVYKFWVKSNFLQ